MKRALVILVLAAAMMASPLALRAQEATPEPTPADWMVYDDPAMHFQAPPGFRPVGQRHVDASKLGDDPVIVAAWIFADKSHVRRLVIQQEYFEGDYKAFESEYEGQMRDQFDSPFFKNKEDVKLRNGMPALYMEMSSGSGFNVQKFYILCWADGQRGVAIVLQTQLNDLDSDTARRMISDVTAVQYPVNRQ